MFAMRKLRDWRRDEGIVEAEGGDAAGELAISVARHCGAQREGRCACLQCGTVKPDEVEEQQGRA